LTSDQRTQRAKDFFIARKVDDITGKSKSKSKSWAFRELALKGVMESSPEPEIMIKKAYYRHKKRTNRSSLPYPYFGRDICPSRENGHFVLQAQDVLIKFGPLNIFGNWKLTF
jgi:hypothetical protein